MGNGIFTCSKLISHSNRLKIVHSKMTAHGAFDFLLSINHKFIFTIMKFLFMKVMVIVELTFFTIKNKKNTLGSIIFP